jgi:hypothetical protein
MVSLSNLTHTCVWGVPNEKVSSTTASVVGLGIDASIDVEGLFLRHNNFKTTYNNKYI